MSHSEEPVYRSPDAEPLDEVSTGLGDEQFRDALAMLLDRVDSLPPDQRRELKGVADATRQRHEQLRQTVARLQETLDTLRVSIKYLVFDVEATRRENDYLRKRLGE